MLMHDAAHIVDEPRPARKIDDTRASQCQIPTHGVAGYRDNLILCAVNRGEVRHCACIDQCRGIIARHMNRWRVCVCTIQLRDSRLPLRRPHGVYGGNYVPARRMMRAQIAKLCGVIRPASWADD